MKKKNAKTPVNESKVVITESNKDGLDKQTKKRQARLQKKLKEAIKKQEKAKDELMMLKEKEIIKKEKKLEKVNMRIAEIQAELNKISSRKEEKPSGEEAEEIPVV
ncbi:MAG: hypothetical protein ACOC2F_00645 [Bacteroidota bacterium]